jgi:hypothetical protein
MPLNSVKGYWIEMLFSATVQLKGSGETLGNAPVGRCWEMLKLYRILHLKGSGEMLGNAQIVLDTSPER